ncbi:MAG: hypothetical protein RJA07_2561 [Bacteroidota bacterium]|jgi:hypothetical protein
MKTQLDSDFLNKPKIYKFNLLIVIALTLFFILGQIFKLLHWPFATELLLLSSSCITGYNICAFRYYKGKHIVNNIFIVVSLVWIVYITIGAFWNDGRPFYPIVLLLFSGFILISFLISEYFKYLQLKN